MEKLKGRRIEITGRPVAGVSAKEVALCVILGCVAIGQLGKGRVEPIGDGAKLASTTRRASILWFCNANGSWRRLTDMLVTPRPWCISDDPAKLSAQVRLIAKAAGDRYLTERLQSWHHQRFCSLDALAGDICLHGRAKAPPEWDRKIAGAQSAQGSQIGCSYARVEMLFNMSRYASLLPGRKAAALDGQSGLLIYGATCFKE
jgi:hypothetical protein